MEPPAASNIILQVIFLLSSIIICAILSFLETKISTIRIFKIKEILQNKKSKGFSSYDSIISKIENSANEILVAILLAYNIANVVAAIISNNIIEKVANYFNLSENIGFLFSIFVTSIIILIADLVPKNLAIKDDLFLLKTTLSLTKFIYYILYPFVRLLTRLTDYLSDIFYNKDNVFQDQITPENEIKFLIDYVYEKGFIDNNKSSMLKNIFDLSTKTVKEIMIPETDIIFISTQNSIDDILDTFTKYNLTRLPVYQNSNENIIGMLHQKDFLKFIYQNNIDKKDKNWTDLIRPLVFIPESAKLLKVLKELQEQKIHIAIVLNEFGLITGLLSLSDIIEEIVGEIKDEYESEKEKIINLKSNSWLVDASIKLKTLNDFFKTEFSTQNSLTLAGFLTENFQYIPKKGEKFIYNNLNFQIQQASHKRIYQVLIYKNELPNFNSLEN